MTPTASLSAEELLHLNLPNKRTELVRGRLVVREPAGWTHGHVAVQIAALIVAHVNANALGLIVAAETGFKLFSDPDTVRAPDVAFVRADRVPSPIPKGFPSIAPDLAVEVLSPDDRPGEIAEKVADWLAAGTQLLWVIDPGKRTAVVHRANGTTLELAEADSLDGESVLPGFSCQLRAVL